MRKEDQDQLEERDAGLSDADISDAYLYLLGRLLVLQQEHVDTRSIGFRWNELIHREAGSVGWSRPNPDIACSDAWIAVDEDSCTIIDIPPIVDRYYTVHVLNMWGETVANLNERSYPAHPWGRFALCLAGSHVDLPPGTHRIDMQGKKARVFAHLEIGEDLQVAAALQQRFMMHATGNPVIDEAVDMFVFTNDTLPGVECLDTAIAVLESDPDVNPSMGVIQEKVRALAVAAGDPTQRAHIDAVIRHDALPMLRQRAARLGAGVNGWCTYRAGGIYGYDWLMRTVVNLSAMWTNTSNEVLRSESSIPLDGGRTYTLTFKKSELPGAHVRYFWSVIALDAVTFRALPNAEDRFLINSHSQLRFADDGSLTLYFAPSPPADAPNANWLPTIAGRNYILEWRAYGADRATVLGRWRLPALVLRGGENGAHSQIEKASPPARRERAVPDVSEVDANELTVEAYVYAFPLVLMDITRRVSTNVDVADGGKAPMNCLAHRRTLPDAAFLDVVCPNADCLTSALWFDVSSAPLLFRVPDAGGRYYVLSMLDMWTEIFAVLGPRTTGDQAQSFALIGPRWRGVLPRGLTELRAPTDQGWMILAVETHGPDDHATVHAFQNAMSVWTLNRYGRSFTPRTAKADPAMDMSAPLEQVDKMDAAAFFALFGRLTQRNPPHVHDNPVLSRMRRIGIDPGKAFNAATTSPAVQAALSTAPAIARQRMEREVTQSGRAVNGWRITDEPIGVYGADYLRRASVARTRLGAMLAGDVLAMTLVSDAEDAPLDGERSYALRFDKSGLPPCRGFWSLTAYSERHSLVANETGRYAIGNLSSPRYNDDGSLDLYIQREDPGSKRRSNWLPSPRHGAYSVVLRVYWPNDVADRGTWRPPPLTRQQRLMAEASL